ncbi:sensor histidine kinase, partial [Kribbia dieselivorans]|uniref:sensor histidine kinase n=1 Tax=Kribbia dieselivorans TaxID=331526 RepID=UPI000838D362
MIRPAHAAPRDASTSTREQLAVPVLLRWAMHVLIAGLLLLAAGRSLVTRPPGWPATVLVAALVGAIYLLGPHLPGVTRSTRVAGLWLAALLLSWLGLLALTPEAIYLAFPWFFLLLHFLPRPVGLVAVAGATLAAIAGFGWHQHTITLAMVIGPVLGAAVAIATVLGYRALHEESERRRRLIIELDRTRADLAAAERRAGTLDERERLAREIHDTLAQGFSSIQLLLQAAGRSLDADRGVDTPRAAGLVEQARQTAHDNLAEARRLIAALAPHDLAESSLAAALQRLCATTTANSGIAVDFQAVGEPVTLPTPIEVALLRIAQGALANTVQHAGASRATVTLTTMDAAVTLDVVDDGIGLPPA